MQKESDHVGKQSILLFITIPLYEYITGNTLEFRGYLAARGSAAFLQFVDCQAVIRRLR